jgi:hypothetical protein
MSLMAAPAPASEAEIAEGLAEQARKFSFKLATDEEAVAVRAALESFGMTGPGDAADALVKMAKAAVTK